MGVNSFSKSYKTTFKLKLNSEKGDAGRFSASVLLLAVFLVLDLTLYWAQDGRLFTSCRAENFKMEDQKWACVLNMEYQWNACMDLNAINCKMCRNEFERDLSDLSMFFYSGFHIYPGECQSHTHKTKSLFFYT